MVKYRNEILSFQQHEGESLFSAWERFKKLLLACPSHGLRPVAQILTFYEGLGEQTQTLVDAAAGGSLTTKSYTEARALLEMMASNHSGRESTRKTGGIHNTDQINVLSAQVAAMQKQLQSLNVNLNANVNAIGVQGPCDWCQDLHRSDQCPSNPESMCYVDNLNRNNNPYSNTYNPGWRNHPNFRWGGNQGNSEAIQRPVAPSGMQSQFRPPPQQERKPSLEEAFMQFMQSQQATNATNTAAIKNLENQVGQLASALNTRPQGGLPSDTQNPRREVIEPPN